MLQIIRANERHFSDMGWLQTYWLFSFSDYHDPQNVQFGALRVFNDDVVQPGKGFPPHPHKEMEIVTVILEGELTHEDKMGNKSVIRAGDVQRMTAGKGLTHSEYNRSDRPVHLYQIWIYPYRPGLEPGYEQKGFDPAQWKNRLLPVASGQGRAGAVSMNADATIYRSFLETGKEVIHKAPAGRRVFLYLTDGQIVVKGETLNRNDQARIKADGMLVIKALQPSDLVMIDVP